MVDPDEQLALARIGQMVGGHWRLERLLGVGGMAAVYEARSEYGSEAAIKLLHPEMNQREDVRERFVQEGELARRIDHDGVVRVRGIYADPGMDAYLVMELLHGETLTDRLARAEGLDEQELLRVLEQLLDVLVEAHEKGVVHRDLKPDNLFLTDSGTLKVLDFGIARLSGAQQKHKTKVGVALGTVPYMAPEQARGKRSEIDARTDLFAVGAMAFRILTGRNVHEARTDGEMLIAMASKPAPPIRSVAPHIRPELARVIDLSLAFEKDNRYPDARSMQEDVRALLSSQAPPNATRLVMAREQATAVDLVAPVLPPTHLPPATEPAVATPSGTPKAPTAATPAVAAVRAAPSKRASRAGLWWALGLTVLGGLALAAYVLLGPRP
jgi:serine/threonine-protein kinase